ncbi:redoxin family protein [Enterovirga rhinocerotis]|uniref:redoxin family protein n=1 Tax=Enterovirga rhinocerotis TaxID=1339210 RepID=UPI0010613660|nr:redoxin family protein [Enterovirga rhinocerotis]
MSRRSLLLGLPALGAGLGLAACSKAVGTVLPGGEMPGLPGLVTADGRAVPGFAADEFRRGPAILNIWASWCPDCRAEHDQLMRLAADDRFRLLGIVFRDKPESAAAHLKRAGNPYAALAMDDGRIPGLLGQKGVPYSYILSRTGRVLARVRGRMDDKAVSEIVMPAIRTALAEAGAAG